MTKKTIITLSVLAGVSLLGIILIFATIGSYNDYIGLENKAKGIQTDNQNVMDNTRKMIREAASVSDKEVASLEKIITGFAKARTSGSGSTGDVNGINIGMIKEACPSITEIKTLQNLQNILVAGRKDWQHAQTRLIDTKRQADNMLGRFPSGAILKSLGKEEIKIVIVTSAETNENFKTGEDNSNWIE